MFGMYKRLNQQSMKVAFTGKGTNYGGFACSNLKATGYGVIYMVLAALRYVFED